MSALLTYDSVEVRYGRQAVVAGLSFTLRAGEILGIAGESGSGKSSILKAALGLLGPEGRVAQGDIWFRGKNLPRLSPKQMRQISGPGLGLIFQDAAAHLCPVRTIGDQIHESLKAHGAVSRAEADEKALDIFAKLNLKEAGRILKSYTFELSGGMNQRVGIAMAMLLNPAVLMADEPTSALDVTVEKQIVGEMLLSRELYGTAIIVVTHNLEVISALADTVMVLKNGRVRECGPAGQVLNRPRDDYTKTLLKAVPRLRRK